jgi:hypothetical protein
MSNGSLMVGGPWDGSGPETPPFTGTGRAGVSDDDGPGVGRESCGVAVGPGVPEDPPPIGVAETCGIAVGGADALEVAVARGVAVGVAVARGVAVGDVLGVGVGVVPGVGDGAPPTIDTTTEAVSMPDVQLAWSRDSAGQG